MSNLLDAIGKLAGNTPAGVIAQGVGEVLDRVLPDPELKRQAQQQAFELIASGTYAEKAQQAQQLAQIDLDKTEAGAGAFRGGWRPWIGWTCGAALTLQFVVAPVAQWTAQLAGYHPPPFPTLDGMLWQVLAGMLGIAGLRTIEKVKGAA